MYDVKNIETNKLYNVKKSNIVLGVIGADCHAVGNKILYSVLTQKGFNVTNLGVMVNQDEFIDAAIETGADAILVSSIYGHGEIDCMGFRGKCIERGLEEIILYVGGNLVIGKHTFNDVENLFSKMGFNRVFHPNVDLHDMAAILEDDIKHENTAWGKVNPVKQGKVKIAVVMTARYFAPKLIALFKAQHKEIELEVEILTREDVINQLENNKVDLAIMGRPPTNLSLESKWFSDHPYVLIAAADHPLAGLKNIHPEQLEKETFFTREADSGTRMMLDHYMFSNKLNPRNIQEITSIESIKQSVMAGMGVAIMSLHTVGLEYQTGHLVVLDIENMPIVKAWYILHMERKLLNPAATTFKAFMQSEAVEYMKDYLPV